jgi:uncharacterized protein YigE (DUF2233 family)
MMARVSTVFVLLLLSLSCSAAAQKFTVMRVDTRSERLELFLRDQSGTPFFRLEKLRSWLASQNKTLRFAMNAGMFEPDYSPVGLFISHGKELAPLNLANGTGNFYLKPNGVFFVTSNGPNIVESSKYNQQPKDVLLATQSGPLLVENGAIHPSLRATSRSRLIRNGVGVSAREAIFVISNAPITLYEFASYFRDQLGCRDALYFDGVVSSLLLPAENRSDSSTDLGPMVGVVQ